MTTLKNVLLINALSSGLTGLLLVVLPAYLAGLFGINQSEPFLEAGIFLIVFAALAAYAAQKQPYPKMLIRCIILMDILWVLLSLAIVLPQLFGLTFIGYCLITAVALWVAMMAYLQIKGFRQIAIQ